MLRVLRIIGIIILLVGLISIRKFEDVLFYDPFLVFFKKNEFNHLAVPEFNAIYLFLSTLFRYSLNCILSLAIIYLWFGDKKIVLFSFYTLIVGFVLFYLLYFSSLATNFGLGYMPTFYIRRILIQPIFLLLLIPAIYYYKYLKTN